MTPLVLSSRQRARDHERTVRARLAEHGQVLATVLPGNRHTLRRLAYRLDASGGAETALHLVDGHGYLLVWRAGERPPSLDG
jgi:hypothetical protein